MYINVCLYIYIYICVFIYAYIYIYIHNCMFSTPQGSFEVWAKSVPSKRLTSWKYVQDCISPLLVQSGTLDQGCCCLVDLPIFGDGLYYPFIMFLGDCLILGLPSSQSCTHPRRRTHSP